MRRLRHAFATALNEFQHFWLLEHLTLGRHCTHTPLGACSSPRYWEPAQLEHGVCKDMPVQGGRSWVTYYCAFEFFLLGCHRQQCAPSSDRYVTYYIFYESRCVKTSKPLPGGDGTIFMIG